MTSDAEASPRATCRATTKAGAPCRKQAVDDGLCMFHSGKLDLAELGRRGGKAGRKKPENTSDRLESLAHAALEELLTSSGNATARQQAARLVLDRVATNSTLSVGLARRALYEEQQAELRARLPELRDKLARLINSHAEARAEELYWDRIRVETEAVNAELGLSPDDRGEGPELAPGGIT